MLIASHGADHVQISFHQALLLALLLCASTGLVSCDETAPAPAEEVPGEALATEWTPEDLFHPERVLDIRITVDPGDWNTLCNQTRSLFDLLGTGCFQAPMKKVFTWFEADATIDGVPMDKIAIRKKGFQGSLDRHRPAIKLDFNRYRTEQSFGGLTRMTLNNMKADPTKIRTCLANEIFTLAGVPASRCNFARVEVNGERLGLYAHVEPMKKPFLREHFSDDEGNLYEGLMSDFEAKWAPTFEKKTNEEEADWSDVAAATDALALEDESFLPAAAEHFDLDAFYTFWAMEVLLGQKDGYADSLNNYHVYHDPDSERFHFIPWSPDTAFSKLYNPNENKPHSVTAHGRLAYRLYLHEPSRDTYIARLKELIETIWDVDDLLSRLETMVTVITPHLTEEEIETMSAELPEIRSYIENQGALILTELEEGAPLWKHTWSDPPCWEPVGEVSGEFATQWNTLNNSSPTSIGWSEIEGTVHGTPLEPLGGSCVAGMGNGQVQQTTDRVEIRVITLLPGGKAAALVLSIHPDDFASDVSLSTDHVSAVGYWIALKSGPGAGEFKGFFTNGILELETIEKTSGGFIGGQFTGELHLPPEDW